MGSKCCNMADQWLPRKVTNVWKNNSAVEYEGINIELTHKL